MVQIMEKIMGLGNLSSNDNRELILKTINFPINDSIVRPTYEHLAQLDSCRIQGSNRDSYTSDGPAFIEKFPEYSIGELQHIQILHQNKKKGYDNV